MHPFRRAAAEFPNDNPELHDGAVWICRDVRGPARAVLRPRAPEIAPPVIAERVIAELEEPEITAEDIIQIEEVDLVDIEEPEVLQAEPAQPEAAEDAFGTLIAALSSVALGAGATRAAAVVGELLEHGSIGEVLVTEAAARTLVNRGWVSSATGTLTLSPATHATLVAWRSVLRGESADFEACGDSTLDAWCAELLAALSGTPERAAELRRALRAQGVAAFGLIAQAA